MKQRKKVAGIRDAAAEDNDAVDSTALEPLGINNAAANAATVNHLLRTVVFISSPLLLSFVGTSCGSWRWLDQLGSKLHASSNPRRSVRAISTATAVTNEFVI
jgi:hypothetical protein